tara:strand:+ start:681 stop:1331 length:651 start_codon:yes stop_codon:yes gene_type:complete
MKVELIIPNNLSEVSLKQYQKYLKIQENNTDAYFLQCKMIEIFCNLDAKTVRLLKLSDADKIVHTLNEMFEIKPELIRTFKMNKIEYGIVPDFDEISLGEYIDLDTYMGDWQNMEIAMNVLYRPIKDKIGKKYTIKEYDTGSKEKLIDIPMDVVLGAVFFLYHLGIDLSTVMMSYLENPKMDNSIQHQIFLESGGGISRFTHSLKEILQELKVSLN